MKANETQVGGEHYRSDYQHWDLCVNAALGYLEGNATRYISRWRKKGGMEDLKKALHYVNKLQEALPQVIGRRGERVVGLEHARAAAITFNTINHLNPTEAAVVLVLATWRTAGDLEKARDGVLLLIDEAEEPTPVPAEDSNKHAIEYSDYFDEEIPF